MKLTQMQKNFIVMGILVVIGIPFLITGIVLPNAMKDSIKAVAREFTMMLDDQYDRWGKIPGEAKINYTKSFYLFNCTNPYQFMATGAMPDLIEVGPFNYEYSQVFGKHTYGGNENSLEYQLQSEHKLSSPKEVSEKNWTIINPGALKQWYAAKHRTPTDMALQGLYSLLEIMEREFLRDWAVEKLYPEFKSGTYMETLLKDLNLTSRTLEALRYDVLYGTRQRRVMYLWGDICINGDSLMQNELATYFGIPTSKFLLIMYKMCSLYLNQITEFKKQVCTPQIKCGNFEIVGRQLLNNDFTISYKQISTLNLTGFIEFPLFKNHLLANINLPFVKQFENVNFVGKDYLYLFNTTSPLKRSSIFYKENMDKLITIGRSLPSIFDKNLTETTLNLTKMEGVSHRLLLTKEQTYLMYLYIDELVNSTFIRMFDGGSIEEQALALHGSRFTFSLFNVVSKYLDVIIYSHMAYAHHKSTTCVSLVKKYLNNPYTAEFIDTLATRLCLYVDNENANENADPHMKFDMRSPLGWKYYIMAFQYPYAQEFTLITQFINTLVPEIKSAYLFDIFYSNTSELYRYMHGMMIDVKHHYPEVCTNVMSIYCTKREMAAHQFYNSYVTKYPPPLSALKPVNTFAEWESDYIIPFAINDYPSIVDYQMLKPFEMKFVEGYFGGGVSVSAIDLMRGMTSSAIGNPMFLYYIMLAEKNGKYVDMYESFASPFFIKYIKYMIRSHQLGPVMSRQSTEESIFSFKDKYLEYKQSKYRALEGEDPCLNPIIMNTYIKTPNSEEAYQRSKMKINSGRENTTRVRYYEKYYGYPYIVNTRREISGSGIECEKSTGSPYTKEFNIWGYTDGLQFRPHSEDVTNVNMLSMEIERGVMLSKYTDIEEYGKANLVKYKWDVWEDIPNITSYGIGITGGYDISPMYQTPAILTQYNYTGCKYIDAGFTIPTTLNWDQGHKVLDNIWGVEEYTGITLQTTQQYMISMLLETDLLFGNNGNNATKGLLVPMWTVTHNMYIPKHQVEVILNEVVTGEHERMAFKIVADILGATCIFGIALLLCRVLLIKGNKNPEVEEDNAADNIINESLVPIEHENRMPSSSRRILMGEEEKEELEEDEILINRSIIG